MEIGLICKVIAKVSWGKNPGMKKTESKNWTIINIGSNLSPSNLKSKSFV